MNERRYCTYCQVKQYTKNMREVHYRLLKKNAWHCLKCLSLLADNLHFLPGQKQRYLLELFSGSKTVSTVASDEFNYRVFNVDFVDKYSPALCADISKLSLKQIPESKRVFAVWASVPCTYYSILNVGNHWDKVVYSHRKYYYAPKTSEAKKAMQLLEKTIWLIRSINPVYYFIENPRGALRHMPQMNFAPFVYTVSYADFGSDFYKPTDIFTNCSFLKFPALRGTTGRKFAGSVQLADNSFERSIVPPGLIRSILQQIDSIHSPGFDVT